MFEIFHMFLLPVIIGIILFSYLEGKLHLSLARSLGVGKGIGLAVMKPMIGAAKQLVKITACSIAIKKGGTGDFKTREHHPPRW